MQNRLAAPTSSSALRSLVDPPIAVAAVPANRRARICAIDILQLHFCLLFQCKLPQPLRALTALVGACRREAVYALGTENTNGSASDSEPGPDTYPGSGTFEQALTHLTSPHLPNYLRS